MSEEQAAANENKKDAVKPPPGIWPKPSVNAKALLVVFAPAAAFALLYLNYKPAEGALIVDTKYKRLKFEAIFNPEGFKGKEQSGYHLIVWKAGGAVKAALFQAQVSDRKILEAMGRFGAEPGNNLKEDCWACRNDPENPASEMKAEGPRIKIEIRWPGKTELVQIHNLFKDTKPEDMDFRFAGNAALIDVWKSGCVACLYSCPGGKFSNAAYSIRDYAGQPKRFLDLAEDLPEKGTRAIIYLTLVEPEAEAPAP
ncbi:MAG: YdjY domain-containing protein [Planctomycetota bacterium]|nr:YdjY domain-containing protein [Planctomycetota bacterium]